MVYTSKSGSEPAWAFEKNKNFLRLPGTEPRTLGWPACNPVSTPNELLLGQLIRNHSNNIRRYVHSRYDRQKNNGTNKK
jgi:hypothetical protein